MSELDTKKSIASLAMALAKAQSEMGAAIKQATNPHFKMKYADLSSVVDACMPALNENGIAVIQPTYREGETDFVKTVLIHGESGETLECSVPLLLGKRDMQGYGSAVTYARRYGLMAMAGIAPEDDDGTAAVASAPSKQTISSEQFVKLRDKIQEAGIDEAKICETYGASSLEQFPLDRFASAMKRLTLTIEKNAAESKPIVDDEIPYQGAPQ